MADSSLDAGGVIYKKLAATAAVTNIVSTRIYHMAAPTDTAYPYVIIGERSTNQPHKAKDATIQSHSIRLYMYSRTTLEDLLTLKAAVFNALEKQTLSPDSSSFVDCFQEGLDNCVVLDDNRTFSATLEMTVVLQ